MMCVYSGVARSWSTIIIASLPIDKASQNGGRVAGASLSLVPALTLEEASGKPSQPEIPLIVLLLCPGAL